MYSVRILADSLASSGKRLTTWELTYPRFIHSEMMTHRIFSRNAASSRAIPTVKVLQQVVHDPAVPLRWGRNQPGMQAREDLNENEQDRAKSAWLRARDEAVNSAQRMMNLGAHKQIVNRLLEPFMFITVILSGTEFDNFFSLRCHEDAQPEIAAIAYYMKSQCALNAPVSLSDGQWHLPLIFPEDREQADTETLIKASVGRCARVSYLTHDGRRDLAADVALHDRLMEAGHWSPFEHVAMASPYPRQWGNFTGWVQYRKLMEAERGAGV